MIQDSPDIRAKIREDVSATMDDLFQRLGHNPPAVLEALFASIGCFISLASKHPPEALIHYAKILQDFPWSEARKSWKEFNKPKMEIVTDD